MSPESDSRTRLDWTGSNSVQWDQHLAPNFGSRFQNQKLTRFHTSDSGFKFQVGPIVVPSWDQHLKCAKWNTPAEKLESMELQKCNHIKRRAARFFTHWG